MRNMISAWASSATTLGARPPEMTPILSVVLPRRGSSGRGIDRIACKASSKRMDGGVAQLGIGGVSEFAMSGELVTERAFAAQDELIFGGFAVDEEARAAGRCGHGFGAGAVAFFADDEEQSEIARAGGEQRFGGRDHGCDDALGVARTASPDGSRGLRVKGRRAERCQCEWRA